MQANYSLWHLRACLGALALMLVLPFLLAHHHNPIPTFFQEWTTALLGLLALTWLARGASAKPLEIPEIALLPIGLMLIAVLQAFLVPEAQVDRLVLFGLYMVWSILLIVLGRRLTTDAGPEMLADVMASAILVGALLEAVTGAAQLTGSGRQPWIFPHLGGGLRGNLAQPNNFADYLWLGVVAALYLRSRARLGLAAAAASLLVLIPFAVLSGSRSIWFYGVGLALLAVAWTSRQSDSAARSLRVWSLGTVVGCIAFQAAVSSGVLPLPEGLLTAGGRLADSGSYDAVRTALWRVALDIFLEHPWVGVGFGQYPQQFFLHVLDLMPRHLPGLPEHAHNLLLNLMAEMGLAAGLLLAVLGLRWALDLVRGPRTPIGWWIAGTMLVLAIHANLEYPLWYAFFLGPAALLAGAASRSNRSLRLSAVSSYAMAACLLLGGLSLFNLYRDYSLLEDTLNHRIAANSADEFRQRVQTNLETLANESLLGPYVDLTAATLMLDNADLLDVKLRTCARAQRFSATREIVFKCAHLLALNGQEAEARLALQRAVATFPDHAREVLKQWRQRGNAEPDIARLVANFPPIAEAQR